MSENITAFDLIQDRLDETADDETLANEEADVMEQRRLNGELHQVYQTYIEAAQAWTNGDRLQDEVQDLLDVEDMAGN